MNGLHQRQSRRAFLTHGTLAFSGLAISPLRSTAFARADPAERFPISLHQYSLKPLFDSGQLELLKYAEFAKGTLGISDIEFAAEFCDDLPASPEKADAIRRRSKQVGVTNRVLLCGDGKALDAVTANERTDAIHEHLKWAKVARRLGCAHIRVRASTQGDPRQQLTHAAAGMGGLCDALASSPVSVLIENIAGLSRDPDWLVALVRKIGPKRVGLIADFGNFDGDIYAGMKRILPYAKSICTKSWDFVAAGNETKSDSARMMRAIIDSNYRGCIAIEYLGQTPVSGIRKTAALIRRYGETA